MATSSGDSSEGRTAWARNLAAPVRSFLSTETGGAAVVVVAVLAALIWANAAPGGYLSVWDTRLTVQLGSHGISATLRNWVDQGLMTLFFLVVGLEAKRQLDLGELRDRQRLMVPALSAVFGVLIPTCIYLAWNAGGQGAHGWGAAISTDTAFALSAVGLLAPRSATRLRVFLLSLSVVDDVIALLVIAVVYTHHVSFVALGVAIGLFIGVLALRWVPAQRRRPLAIMLGFGVWLAMFESGIDPVISGLAVGLATSAYPPSRENLSEVLELTRSFREQPTPELARAAQRGLTGSISANERLQYSLHPWTSYVIVPLFALSNAGIHITGSLLSAAATSPITLGIITAYVLGKPIGVMIGSWIATRPMLRGPRSPISPPVLLAAGTTAGTGFTVSLLVSSLAFHGQILAEAKLGALCTLVIAPALGFATTRAMRLLPAELRARQIAGTADDILDLAEDVDPERDHTRGSDDAPVTIVEYGDFECPFCGQAEPAVRELLNRGGSDIRYVWRHLPLNDVHPNAQLAAEASEAASAQGAFWEIYEILLGHQGELTLDHLADYGEQLGLDVERYLAEIRHRVYVPRIQEDVASADESGVSGTPTFFINGRRHYGAYDLEALTLAVGAAKRRALQVQSARIPA
jgi:Na+/H+ antiporter NhaA